MLLDSFISVIFAASMTALFGSRILPLSEADGCVPADVFVVTVNSAFLSPVLGNGDCAITLELKDRSTENVPAIKRAVSRDDCDALSVVTTEPLTLRKYLTHNLPFALAIKSSACRLVMLERL